MNETFFQWYDRMGRPTLRNIGVVLLALLGLAIVVQFFFWAILNREPAPIPLQNILVAALPYAMQTVQEITRSLERKTQLTTNAPAINPHGGPNAP